MAATPRSGRRTRVSQQALERTRTQLSSAYIQLYSLRPLYSRGALNTHAQHRLPALRLAYSARRAATHTRSVFLFDACVFLALGAKLRRTHLGPAAPVSSQPRHAARDSRPAPPRTTPHHRTAPREHRQARRLPRRARKVGSLARRAEPLAAAVGIDAAHRRRRRRRRAAFSARHATATATAGRCAGRGADAGACGGSKGWRGAQPVAAAWLRVQGLAALRHIRRAGSAWRSVHAVPASPHTWPSSRPEPEGRWAKRVEPLSPLPSLRPLSHPNPDVHVCPPRFFASPRSRRLAATGQSLPPPRPSLASDTPPPRPETRGLP